MSDETSAPVNNREGRFTPGQWFKRHDEHYGLWHVASDGQGEGDRDVASFCTIEDADLIQAAPDLFMALVELDRLRDGCSPDELGAIVGKRVAAFVEQYRAALTKARGEAA